MRRYAVVFKELGGEPGFDLWIEFYDADDLEHAIEQAENAHPGEYLIVAEDPQSGGAS